MPTPLQHDPQWDDLRVSASAINPLGADADATRNQDNGLLEFSASAVNTIAFTVQLPHSWAEASAIVPHVHWRKKTQGTGKVKWSLAYGFANPGEAFPDATTLTVKDVAEGTADDGTALVHLISSFGEVAMTGKKISCQGVFVLKRLGDDLEDDFAGVAQLLEFDLHYRTDSNGSNAQWTKQGSVITQTGGGYNVGNAY